MRLRRIVPFVLISLLLAAPTAAAETEITRELKPLHADAAAGLQAWASWDPAVAAYRLVTRGADGALVRPPVDPGIAPFELDVGTDADGDPLVSYARCPRRCDLYVFDPATGDERRLPARVNTAADEIAPSIYAGRIVFARVTGSRRNPRARVYSAPLTGASRPRPLFLGGRTVVGVTATENSARGLFVNVLTPSEFRTQRLLRLFNGRIWQLDRATSGGANAANMTKPTVRGSYVYYARTNNGSGTGNRFYRIRIRSGYPREQAQGRSRTRSAAWLGNRFLVAESPFDLCGDPEPTTPAASDCRLFETDPIRWTPAPSGKTR